MGKDFARERPSIDMEYNNIFGYNESYKQKFPIDKYLKSPALAEKKKKLNEVIEMDKLRSLDEASSIKYYAENRKVTYSDLELEEDTPHPSDPNRSFIKDSVGRLKSLIAKKHK